MSEPIKLVSAKTRHYKGKVHDLTVTNTHSYNVQGVPVHNCGGSLVSYLLGITDVDPIRFNLLFERFINPERLDLPDADLDFMSSKRHLVVEYLTEKYGADRVAGISNYASLASASALRDAGRVFGMNGLDLVATKLVPKEHGQSFTLTESAKVVPELEKFRDANPEIWKHALKLEGVMRSFGQHAAGVIVAGEPLIERAVVETRSGSPVVNWDKRVVEDFGLVKMDLLGLSTLDVLEIVKVYIKERHGKTVDYLKLPLEEKDVMDAFGRGDTTGVFQFESCLAGSVIVDGMTILERFEKQTVGASIRTLDQQRHEITQGSIAKVVHAGQKMVYSLKLKNGKTIKATADHRFYKDGKWVRLGDLMVGDKVLSVRTDNVECEK